VLNRREAGLEKNAEFIFGRALKQRRSDSMLCECCRDLHFEHPARIMKPVNATVPLSWHEAAESGFSAALFFGIDA